MKGSVVFGLHANISVVGMVLSDSDRAALMFGGVTLVWLILMIYSLWKGV